MLLCKLDPKGGPAELPDDFTVVADLEPVTSFKTLSELTTLPVLLVSKFDVGEL